MRREFFYLGLVIAITLLTTVTSAASSTSCVPPAGFQSEVRARASAEIYEKLGNWYGQRQQYGCAVEAFRSGLKQYPQSANLFYLVGLDLLRMGKFEVAIEPLQRSIGLKPDVLKPHLLLATAFEQLQQTTEARKEWLAAVKIDPHSEMALDGASKNLLSTNDYASVIELLGAQPKEDSLILDLAAAYEGSGSPDQASDLLEKAVREKPSSSILTRRLIALLMSQKRLEKATDLAGKLVQQHPHDLEAQVLYLHALVLNNDDDQARMLAHKLVLTAPHNFGVLYLNGVLENRSGNYETARIHLEQAVRLDPNDRDARFNLGLTLSQLHDLTGAREQFEKALALGAKEPEVRFEYAKVLSALGETKLAAEQLQMYQQQHKESADHTAAAIKTAQADKELETGDPKKALGLYREALTATPDNAILNFKLSVALDRVGDQAGEIEALKKAIQLDPKMAIAHYQLGYLASLTGDFVLAENQYGEAVKAAPRYVQAWIGLAATLGTESRFPEAKQAVGTALKLDPKNANAIELQKELESGAAQTNQ